MTLPPDFPWRGGMRYRLSPTLPWCRYEGDDASDADGNPARETPPTQRSPLVEVDPNDGATLGALLAEVRRKHGLPDLYVKPLLPGGWTVTRPFTVPTILWEEQWGLTEFDALLAAWNARPVKP